MTEDARENKSALRETARRARRALSDGERERGAREVAETLLTLHRVVEAGSVLSYGATRDEIDPAPLTEELRRRGTRVAKPRVADPVTLALHWVDDTGELVPGAFGIREPADDSPVAYPDEIDVALVPGVAFDLSGHRLGYGGGFYDRLLPLLRDDALTIGLAFDEQVVDEIPSLPHDVAMDLVVTPTRVLGSERPG